MTVRDREPEAPDMSERRAARFGGVEAQRGEDDRAAPTFLTPGTFFIRLIIRVLSFAILLRFGSALLGYLTFGAWQLLVLVFFSMGVMVGLGAAWYLVRRGRDRAAAWTVIGALLVGALSQVFFLQGMTLSIIIGSALLLAAAGTFMVKGGWRLGLGSVAFLILASWLADSVLVWPRYTVAGRLLEWIYLAPAILAVALMVLAFSNLEFFRSGSIRLRLLLAFILAALLPGLLIVAASIYFSTRSATERVFGDLQEVARTRVAQTDAWVRERQSDLAMFRALELSDLRSLLKAEVDSQAFRYAYTLQKARFQAVLGLQRDFDVLFLVNDQGAIVLSTDLLDEASQVRYEDYFVEGLHGPYVSPVQRSELLDDFVVTVSLPISNSDGQPVGVLVGQSRLERIQQAVLTDRVNLDSATEIYLVDAAGRLLTDVASAGFAFLDTLSSEGVEQVLTTRSNGSALYDDYEGVRVLGVYRWMPQLQVAMLVEIDRIVVFRTTVTMIWATLGATLLSSLVAGVGALLMTRDIARPLTKVAETADQIAAGDLNQRVPIFRRDEIGRVAYIFNRMTDRLRETINGLEDRVAERTADLERRSAQLETAALVSRQAASIRDVDRLLDEVVQEIAEQFGFYHVGIYLLDESRREGLLRAASPGGGERLLARGFTVEVGATGMVGDVAATGQPAIALDVTSDVRYVAVPELPETRSEICLPLRARDELIGVLDVQSREVAFFSQEDVVYLQVMADQIGLALDNARLLTEAEQRLLEIGRLVQGQQYEGWRRLVAQRPHWAYLYNGLDVLDMDQTDLQLEDPDITFALGDQEHPIGRIKVATRAGGELDTAQVELARAIAEESGQALERARLFSNTQEALLEAGILYRGSRAIAEASSLQGVLLALVEHVVTDQVDLCALLLHERYAVLNRDWLRVAASWRRPVDVTEERVSDVEVDAVTNLVGRGWYPEHFPGLMDLRTDVVVLTEDMPGDPASAEETQTLNRALFETFGLRSALLVPLAAGQTEETERELLGWLIVGTTETAYQFNALEQRLYRGLVGQVETMVRNVQLLALATGQAERERLVSTMGAQIRSSTDVETILRTSVRELGRMLKATEGVIRLETREPDRDGDQVGHDDTVVVEGG